MFDNQLHPEYRTFLRLLRLLAYYAPEHFYHLPSTALSEDYDESWVREHIHDLHLISQDDYLEHLYTHRHVEENLHREFLTNSDLIYLIGPLGSGKTSLALRLRKDLHSSALHPCYVAYIDVRHALSGRDQSGLAGSDLREFLRRLVIDAYLSDMFPYKRSSGIQKNPALELYAYLLDRSAQPIEAQGISQGLTDLQNQAALIFDGYSFPKLEQGGNTNYYDWLEHQGPQSTEVREILRALGERLDLKHLVSAARQVKRMYRQVIWFDNVDALEYGQQDAIHDHLRSFQTNVAALASIVIALRDENIRHFDLREMKHEHGAPPYGRKFIIEMPMSEHQFSYPGHVLPPPSEETLRSAIRKRLEATRRLQSKKLRALNDLKGKKEAEYAGEVDGEYKVLLGRQLSEIDSEIAHYSPAISTPLYNHLADLSARTVEVLISEKASHLANNSLREVFRIHRDFLADLLRRGTNSSHRPVALDYKSWYLATLFLGWIRSTERPFKLSLEDVFEHLYRWRDPGNGRVIGCSLPYLIINTLWNTEIEKSKLAGKRVFPTLEDLNIRLSLLGYDEAKIFEQLKIQIERSIIQLRFPEQLFERGPETQLYATYCGKCLTGSTFNSFGYLVECLEKAKRQVFNPVTDDRSHPMAVLRGEIHLVGTETGALHQHLDTESAISQLIPYLFGVAQMHISELTRIRESGEFGTVGWLARYRDIFGIPSDKDFARVELSGRPRGERKSLQLEAMLNSLLSYVKKFPEEKRKLAKILSEYSRALYDLGKFRELQEHEFMKILIDDLFPGGSRDH